MKRSYPKILRNRKRRIRRRLDPERGWSDQAEPIIKASNIHYEMAEKARAVNCGGIGAIHLMVNKLGLRQEIDSRLHLLKKLRFSHRYQTKDLRAFRVFCVVPSIQITLL